MISGNDWEGVHIVSGSDNVVEEDYIDLSVGGNEYVGNAESGVWTYAGASDNIIGGTMPGTQNLIAFNAQSGVDIGGYGTTGNVVKGDDIESNGNNGVQFDPNATQNLIENDPLADNGASGVYFAGGSYANSVVGCVIEYNTWGVYDAGSNDTETGDTASGNTISNYVW